MDELQIALMVVAVNAGVLLIVILAAYRFNKSARVGQALRDGDKGGGGSSGA